MFTSAYSHEADTMGRPKWEEHTSVDLCVARVSITVTKEWSAWTAEGSWVNKVSN
jgi:hypothetical protein